MLTKFTYLFGLTPDTDREILLNLDGEQLFVACAVNRYINNLCDSVFKMRISRWGFLFIGLIVIIFVSILLDRKFNRNVGFGDSSATTRPPEPTLISPSVPTPSSTPTLTPTPMPIPTPIPLPSARPKRNRFHIIQILTGAFYISEFFRATESVACLAKLHGYGYSIEMPIAPPDPFLYKLIALQNHIENVEADWFLLLDADLFALSLACDFEDYVDDGFSLIVGLRPISDEPMSGSIFVRKDAYGLNFVKRMIRVYSRDNNADNGAMMIFLHDELQRLYENSSTGLKKETCVFSGWEGYYHVRCVFHYTRELPVGCFDRIRIIPEFHFLVGTNFACDQSFMGNECFVSGKKLQCFYDIGLSNATCGTNSFTITNSSLFVDRQLNSTDALARVRNSFRPHPELDSWRRRPSSVNELDCFPNCHLHQCTAANSTKI